MNNAARNQVFSGMESQRHNASIAARPQFSNVTPAQRAGELISRMEISKMHGDRAAFLAAQAELKMLVEQM